MRHRLVNAPDQRAGARLLGGPWLLSSATRAVVADRGHQGHKLARALNQNPAIQFSGIHA